MAVAVRGGGGSRGGTRASNALEFLWSRSCRCVQLHGVLDGHAPPASNGTPRGWSVPLLRRLLHLLLVFPIVPNPSSLSAAFPAPDEVVEWVNARTEQCAPYDLVVRRRGPGREVLAYVEVKTSAAWAKTYFEVSHREWLFAQQEGGRYHIYRVFGAGRGEEGGGGRARPPGAEDQVRVRGGYGFMGGVVCVCVCVCASLKVVEGA